MNAQSNHPINDTDPQFLGPEAGQQAEGFEEPTYDLTATYSPDDNKLRMSSAARLDNWGNGGANFTRTVAFDKLAGVMTAA